MAIDTTKKVKKITVDGVTMQLISDAGEEVVIKLPEEFAPSTRIYHFKVDDDRYLLSAYGWGSGLWEYTVSTEKANQIYAAGDSWLYFKEVPNGVLVSTHQSGNSGLLFYDKSTGVITRKTQSGYGYQYFYKINNSEMLIKGTGTSRFLVYNTADDSVIDIGYNANNLGIVVDEGDNAIWGLSTTNVTLGVWKFDPSTYKFVKLADKGYNFKRFVFKDVIIYSGADYALLYHDRTTDIITVISEGVNMYIDTYSNITQVGKNFLIPPRRQDQPIRLIEGDTLTLKEVYPALNSSSTSTLGSYISPVSDSIVLVSGSSSFGIVCYDNTTQTATQIYEGVSAVSFKHTINGKMIGATYVSVTSNKVLSYDIATNTVSEIYTVESGMYDSKQAGDNILFVAGNASSAWKGVLVYNGATESIEKLYTSGYGWRLYVIGNDCLISSSVSSYTGILVFDGDAMTITKKYSLGYYWEFKMDDNGRFIGATENISSWDDWILEYSSENKTITLKEYIVR